MIAVLRCCCWLRRWLRLSRLMGWFLRNPCSVCWVMRMSFLSWHKTSVLSALSATVVLLCSSDVILAFWLVYFSCCTFYLDSAHTVAQNPHEWNSILTKLIQRSPFLPFLGSLLPFWPQSLSLFSTFVELAKFTKIFKWLEQFCPSVMKPVANWSCLFSEPGRFTLQDREEEISIGTNLGILHQIMIF